MPNIVTEDQQKTVGTLAIRAALEVFNQLDEDESELRKLASATIKATQAAQKIINTWELEIDSKTEGLQYVHFDFDSIWAASTAFYFYTMGAKHDGKWVLEVTPNSLAAARYIGFSQGLSAAKFLHMAIEQLEDEEEIGYMCRNMDKIEEISLCINTP